MPSLSGRGSGTAVEYTALRKSYEVDVGLTTPEWLWRCPSCGATGCVFPEEAVEEAEGISGVLGSMESDLGESGGGVNVPVARKTRPQG